jgi:hypothetical protein
MALYDFVSYCEKEPIPKRLISSRTRKKHALSAEADDDYNKSDCDEDNDNEPALIDPSMQIYTKDCIRFKSSHPQYRTHWIRCHLFDGKMSVPNILGGPIPRSDQGDREFYCLTMLALFQPWRTGIELKGDLQLWSDAFTAYKFSNYFLSIMSNFNLKWGAP